VLNLRSISLGRGQLFSISISSRRYRITIRFLTFCLLPAVKMNELYDGWALESFQSRKAQPRGR